MAVTVNLNGLLYPAFFPEKNYYLMSELPLRKEDVILSTYPKCGTHWVAYILWSLLHPEEEPPTVKSVLDEFPIVDVMGLKRYADSPEDQGRLLATHLPYNHLQKNPSTKYIVVIRNPLDCCVSLYHFSKNFPNVSYVQDAEQEVPNDYFEDFVKGNVVFGDFFEHLMSWYDHRNDPNIHIVVFEKLKANPKEEVSSLISFMGLEKQLLSDDGQILQKVIEQSSFSAMKEKDKNTASISGRNVEFLRKGQAGGYKSALTASQIKTLKDLMEEKLQSTEILDYWRGI